MYCFFFFKQKTAYEMRISDWSSDVCSSDLGSRAAAVGLPGREATVFERPHTEANYITREMAFQVARSHARWLRLGASALVLGGPLLAWLLLAAGIGSPVFALATAAVLLLAGAFVERWLFFAQARHVVTLDRKSTRLNSSH